MIMILKSNVHDIFCNECPFNILEKIAFSEIFFNSTSIMFVQMI